MASFDLSKLSSVSKHEEFQNARAGAAPRTPEQVLAGTLDKQIDLARNPNKEGARHFKVVGDKAAFTIRYANSPMAWDDGETTKVVAVKDLPAALEAVKQAVLNDGLFAKQIAERAKSVQQRTEKMRQTRNK